MGGCTVGGRRASAEVGFAPACMLHAAYCMVGEGAGKLSNYMLCKPYTH